MTGEKTGIDIIDNCPECVFPVIICAEHFRAVRLALEGAAKAAEIVRAQMQDAWASASAELVRALAHLKPPVGEHLVTAYPWLRDGSVDAVHLFPLKTLPPERWSGEVMRLGEVTADGRLFAADVDITVRKRAPLWAGTDEASRERGPIGEILDVTTVGSRVYAHGVTSDQEAADAINAGVKFASIDWRNPPGGIVGAYVLPASLYPWAPIRPWSGRESEGNFDDD